MLNTPIPHCKEPAAPIMGPTKYIGLNKLELFAMHMMQVQPRKTPDGRKLRPKERAVMALQDARAVLWELESEQST